MECPYSDEQLTCTKYFNPMTPYGRPCTICLVDNPWRAQYFHMPCGKYKPDPKFQLGR